MFTDSDRLLQIASEQHHHVLLLSRCHLRCDCSVTRGNPVWRWWGNNGCSPCRPQYSKHFNKPKLLTALAWLSPIFITAEAPPIVFPTASWQRVLIRFSSSRHIKQRVALTHVSVSHVLFYFQSIIISIVVILLNSTSDLWQRWSLPFPPVLTSATILSTIKQETEVYNSQQRSNNPQTIFLPCYLLCVMMTLLSREDMASSWAVTLGCTGHLIQLPSRGQTLLNSGGVHIQRWDQYQHISH